MGQPAGTLANDPHDSVIGQAQFSTWRANYGASLGDRGITPVSAPVPEPAGLTILLLAGLLHATRRYRRV